MQQPGEIRKLDQAVVNRIAAGEIIQRPANALKELLENSLDAQASYIQVTVKSGGLKLLQIQDNGTGIRKDDLAIVCERFTTSKLSKFEDLTEIATFGFRGEALASISHVAHLSIQTKTAQERCAYKANYADGQLQGAPKSCAGNQGTIISIENLFHNMPQRRQALKSPAEEFQKISDVLCKYAVHNCHVGFALRKQGEQQPSLKTQPNSTRKENIRIIYGAGIAKELLEFNHNDAVLKFQVTGMLTQVNYSSKKCVLLLFINQRLVECAPLKAAVDAVYASYLPRGQHPFVYLSLTLPPQNLDVNVHPTKHEVHFLYEDEIIEKLKTQLETQLLGNNATRSFYKQLKLPGAVDLEQTQVADKTQHATVYAKELVRTDSKEQKLDKYLTVAASSTDLGPELNLTQQPDETSTRAIKQVRLSSVLDLQSKVESSCNVQVRSMIRQLVYVGYLDGQRALCQYETQLYMFNMRAFAEELFYQRLIFDFQNFKQISIEPALCVKQLLLIALESDAAGWTPEDGDKEELANSALNILLEKAAIMREYFALRISPAGYLESLPTLLSQHSPCPAQLPLYMLRLATEVDWEQELQCFESFSRETARYYAQLSDQQPWYMEHILFPALKKFMLPPTRLKRQFYELTSLPRLYKVFERC